MRRNILVKGSAQRYQETMTRQRNLAINDKWTALEDLLGWRHFRICGRRYRDGLLELELMAACDRAARVWLTAEDLADRGRFVHGWVRLPKKA